MPTLYIIRGLPGSGKTRLANTLFNSGVIYGFWEADQFMINEDGEYEFNSLRLHEAHGKCKAFVEHHMIEQLSIAVSNTSTTEREVQPYLDLAEEYDYDVVSLIVENRHGNKSVHGVPDDKLQQMRQRFSVKL